MRKIDQPSFSYSHGVVRRALWLYLWVFLSLSLVGWLPEIAGRLGAQWVSADYSALFHPTDTFDTSASFQDLIDFTHSMQHPSGTALAGVHTPFNYPPAAAYIYEFFLRLFAHPVAAYLIAFGLTLVLAAWILWRNLGRTAGGLVTAVVALTLVLGSPQIFTANRGNLEWVNWALTTGGVIAFAKRRYFWTAVLLGLAISIKPFPIIFFALLLWRRRYIEVAVGVLVTSALSLAALLALGPTIPAALHGIRAGGKDYIDHFVLVVRTAQEFRFNHSLLDAIKVFVWFLFDHQSYDPRQLIAGVSGVPLWARMDLWARGIVALSIASVGWIGWRFRRMPVLNGIFALTIAEMLLPYSAAEYTLLLLYVPWGLLLISITTDVASGRLELRAGEMARLLVPCAVLFTPLSFMNCLTGVTKTLLLLYLLVEVCRIPLPSSLFGELDRITLQDQVPDPLNSSPSIQ